MSEMNGATPQPIAVANPAIIKILEDMIIAAKAGQIDSLGLVIVGQQGQVMTPWHGNRIIESIAGAHLLCRRLEDIVINPPVAAAGPRIVRAGPLPGLAT